MDRDTLNGCFEVEGNAKVVLLSELFFCSTEQVKENEEQLNRVFINIFGLQEELSPDVDDNDMTIHTADLNREIRSFISYAVGCMFGRYSICKPGLAYAGGEWDSNAYENAAWIAEGKPETVDFYHSTHFILDEDNILPICDDDYFEDDILGRFIEFVSLCLTLALQYIFPNTVF